MGLPLCLDNTSQTHMEPHKGDDPLAQAQHPHPIQPLSHEGCFNSIFSINTVFQKLIVKYAILTAYPAINFQHILLIEVPLRPPKDIFLLKHL